MRTVVLSAIFVAAALPFQVAASTVDFNFAGPGVSGSIELTYGTATDSKYPQAFEVTGISGVFSDSNNGLNLVDVPIGPLEPINHATPEPTNLLAPNDFSRFAVASGLSPQNNGFLTFDNLYYPGGSPQTASDYPGAGGILDIYGLMFNIGGGQVVDLWSNGDFGGGADYGVAVATSATALDYVAGGVTVTPEPGALPFLCAGLISMVIWRVKRGAKSRLES
jgi:hypothetical protein